MTIKTKSLISALRHIKQLQRNICETYLEKQNDGSWIVYYYELTDDSSLWD